MNSPCAKCSKTVYPVEKLNLLDKVWHKGCFKCETCNITLSLKTYKGYNKNPYCNVHYPTTKFTAVADTPESLRLKKVGENLSQTKYHKEFMSSKGTKMSVADDPESLRTKRNQDILSQTKYHGKDRTNPATTPLARPSFSAPAGEEAGGEAVDAAAEITPEPVATPVAEPARVATPEPVRVPTPEPEVAPVADPEPEVVAEAEPEPAVEPEPIPEPAPVVEPEAPVEPEPVVEAAPEPAPEPVVQPEPVAPEPVTAVEPVVEAPVEAPKTTESAIKYIAVYDYDANDDDEVTIVEGDIVINGEVIAEGWMVGTNTRTGCHGMLPSNYVELVNTTTTGGS